MNAPRSENSGTPRINLVVVGVDGSASARRAALWAANEATLRAADLLLVHAFDLQAPMVAGMLVIPPAGFDGFQESAQAVLDSECAAIEAAFPTLEVSGQLAHGSAFGALLTSGEHALVTVVGSDGLGAFAKRILGSVSLRLAGHAESPVVVVRTESEDQPVREGGPVLVGVDGSTDSEDALVFAFEEASLRGVDLIAVRAWDDTDVIGFGRAYPLPVNRDEFEDQERRAVAEQLAGWAEKYPDVHVHQRLVCGRPAPALLAESLQDLSFGAPSLLVVGCRGHGGFVGLMLGSVSQALIAHAPCPVAVITSAHRH